MNTSIYINKKHSKYLELIDEKTINLFKNIKEESQAKVLLEILNLLTNKKTTFDLKDIGIKVGRGRFSFNLSKLSSFIVIEQSITGFYEKEITIIGDKENDMENNNS